MNEFARGQGTGGSGYGAVGRADMAVDAGLRSFMLGVYNKMALGLALTAILALAASNNAFGLMPGLTQTLFTAPLLYIIMFGPIALLLISSFAMRNPSPVMANALYWGVVSLIGVGMGALVLVYARIPNGMELIAKAFFITSAAFAGLSLYGYTTKKDLSGWGSFLIMGVIGLVIAGVVNIFLKSSALDFAISAVGVLIFSGLVAYDTQNLKTSYYQFRGDKNSMSVATSYGALSLYINFINLFRMILSLISPRD